MAVALAPLFLPQKWCQRKKVVPRQRGKGFRNGAFTIRDSFTIQYLCVSCRRLSARVGNAQSNGFTKRRRGDPLGALRAALAAIRVARAPCPPRTRRTTQIMAAMEHHKRSKAAIGIMEHRGGER